MNPIRVRMEAGHTREGKIRSSGDCGAALVPVSDWRGRVQDRQRPFSSKDASSRESLGGGSPSQTLLPLAAWQGSMAFQFLLPDFQRTADARRSRPSPSGALTRGLDRLRSTGSKKQRFRR